MMTRAIHWTRKILVLNDSTEIDVLRKGSI